jgi:hypothetical protein
MNDVPNIAFCIVCSKQKYGPGNGFCFDCHNHAVHVLKLVNRKIISKADGMKKVMEGPDGQVRPLQA